jgi:hypothetical protein
MYLAAKLDVPPPPSEFSLSEVVPGSLHTKKNKESQDHFTSTLTKVHPLINHTSPFITNSAKAFFTSPLDKFLHTFQPSLKYTAPILTSLGIHGKDHF